MIFLALACTSTPVRPDRERHETGTPIDPGDTAEQVPGSAETPGEALFDDDTVHELAIGLSDEAWDALITDPRSWVEGTFTAGEEELVVGVRLKGYSSFDVLTGKPNFKVSFDHYVDGQRFDGLEAVDLIGEAEDPARMSEAIAYRLFRSAGLPASRTGFAHLEVAGLDYGLYTLVEKKDDVLIDRVWPDDDDGTLYESSSDHWPCDLDDPGHPRCDCWEQEELGDDSRADLESLCAVATDTDDADWYTTIQSAVDWPAVRGHMAMEMVLDAYDHYAGYMGNVYLYHEGESWALIPASMNSVFGSSRYVPGSCGTSGRVPTDFAGGLLARRCWADEACTDDLLRGIGEEAEEVAASDALERIDAWQTMLQPYVEAEPRLSYTVADYTLQVACIRDWLEARPAELAPLVPASCLGKDGDLDVTGFGDLSTNGSCDRAFPDAVAYAVTGIDGAVVTVAEVPDGIEAKDEVLLYVGQGSEVGTYAFADVLSVDGTTIVLTAEPGLEGEKIQVVRVPHYDEVRIGAGGVLTTGAWDGERGGVLVIRAETLTIDAGGAIEVSGLGYAGGPTGSAYNDDGYQGESVEGPGIGGSPSGSGYNEANGAWAANLGGGGCEIGGGGGEHAGGATPGISWNGTSMAPEAGEVLGEPELERPLFGSGGGGVVQLGGSSGPGGAGGGLLILSVTRAEVAEGGRVAASGEDGSAWAAGTWTYGAGGGAGGSLILEAQTLVLGAGTVEALGGAGYADVDRPGGDGGFGRIRVGCDTVNGVACADGGFDGLVEPTPWVGE